jgi:cytochrome c553
VVTVCSKCHGKDGNSTSPNFPKLAGQHKEYLLNQLKAFRNQSRKDPDAHTYMWGISQLLDDTKMVKLADYFSAQKPTRGTPGNAQLAAKGKVIFENGIESKKVPACVFCHTRNAEGIGIFPRLAGQHQQYLVQQIKVFHSDDRPVYARIMKSVVEKLSEEEAEQVAAFLQGL